MVMGRDKPLPRRDERMGFETKYLSDTPRPIKWSADSNPPKLLSLELFESAIREAIESGQGLTWRLGARGPTDSQLGRLVKERQNLPKQSNQEQTRVSKAIQQEIEDRSHDHSIHWLEKHTYHSELTANRFYNKYERRKWCRSI